MIYVTEKIMLPTPPDHLLEFDYVRMKTNKCLDILADRSLDDCLQEQIQKWKSLIQNEILLLRESEESVEGCLQQLFRGTVVLKQHDEKEIDVLSQVRIVILEIQQNEEKTYCLSDRAKSVLCFLKGICSPFNLRNACIFVPTDTQAKVLNTSGEIYDHLGQKLTVNSLESSDEYLAQHINQCCLQNLEYIEEKIRDIAGRHRLADMDLSFSSPLDQTLETLVNLKRILSPSTKSNHVDRSLQTTFESMRDFGYEGHAYIYKRLILYLSESTNKETKDALVEAAEKSFDDVKCEVVPKTKTIMTCTLRHGEKCKNNIVSEERGTLGAFAKDHSGQIFALTVPHFVKEGDIVYRESREIGSCIWPRFDQGMSLKNEISVVKIHRQLGIHCTFLHETLFGEMRPFCLNTQTPKVYAQVFKGRQDTGLMKGRIVSTEAHLPFNEGPLHAYVVEGDDQTPFMIAGDSGDVVKFVREENGQLKGVSVIFGETLELPGIERGTCITIPLHAAVNRFQTSYGTNLTFT